MAGVFQNIEPSPHSPPGECVSPLVPLVQGEHTLAGWRGGWGVNILEDTRHSSVFYVCKYFVHLIKQNYLLKELLWPLSPVTSILGGVWVPLIKQNYLLRELLRPLSPVTSILGGVWVTLIKQNYLLRELLRPLSPVTSILVVIWVHFNQAKLPAERTVAAAVSSGQHLGWDLGTD